MRRLLKWFGTTLLFLVVAICLAPTFLPPFLDRVYYEGPVSDHFDGQRFFNPDASAEEAGRQAARGSMLLKSWARGERASWPEQLPVRQSVPPPRVAGDAMLVTWIGHASVLIQTQGLNILTDPVWSERVSPFPFIGPTRVRAPGVAFDSLPKVDLVLISHNHYDHLDLATLERLWKRDRPLIVTPLGNDTILKAKGIASVAADWGGRVPVRDGIDVLVERNHHWSSRWGADRNRALWSAFTVRLPGGNIFFAGDTALGDGTWIRQAAAHGPFRFAMIPIGAYEPRDFMKSHHVNPEEAMAIFAGLDPGTALGIHWGTVQLTNEAIDDPPRRLAALRRARGLAPGRFVAPPPGASFRVSKVSTF